MSACVRVISSAKSSLFMKREPQALLFLLLPTGSSVESFVNLAREDDHERDISGSEERDEQLRNSVKNRRGKIYVGVLIVVFVVLLAKCMGVGITINWLSQLATSVVLVILLRLLKMKTEERMFDRNDLFERTLDLGESILF